MIQRVEVADLKLGQHRVAEDVVDVSGRLLLSAGTVLDQRHKRVLMTWGVAAVSVIEPGCESSEVSGASDASGSSEPSSVVAEADTPAAARPSLSLEEQLQRRFELNDLESPLLRRLYLAAERELGATAKTAKGGA